MPTLPHFLAELRRRKVYRVALVYAAVAFVVWQVADIAVPSLGLPEAALTLVLVLTLLGFPVALVLAWAYELKPEQAEPPPAPAAQEPTGPSRAASVAAAHLPRPATIAVLPFEDMSTEPESEYFAAGISEELTYALGRMPRRRRRSPHRRSGSIRAGRAECSPVPARPPSGRSRSIPSCPPRTWPAR